MSARDLDAIEVELLDERRREKLASLREQGVELYPASRAVPHSSADCKAAAAGLEPEGVEALDQRFTIAGRIRFKREMGKAGFAKINDRHGTLQIFIKKDLLGEEGFALWKRLDLGDWVRASGGLMVTRTGELSLRLDELSLASKCLRSLPDKHQGMTDVESRFRQRYADLMVNDEVRDTFRARSLILREVRRFFDERDYLEVETPMMQVIPGGAAARPFITHHNALDMDMYLRIAPELYLKRLVVGGFERVYELNRNFRNEGLSLRHNPEFTMLEWYQAHATYVDLMDMTEALVNGLIDTLIARELIPRPPEGRKLPWGEAIIDFDNWRRATMGELLAEATGMAPEQLEDPRALRARWIADHGDEGTLPSSMGKWWEWFFEAYVEETLVDPVFVTRFPVEISPLSRRCDDDPRFVDRFELIVAGQEIANGFNELNDPIDQAARFEAQVAARGGGDDEAMYYDADYIEALCYGMPPAAGEGMGIDRLAMLLTNQQSIREVILFPAMKPRSEAAAEPTSTEDE
jgi:lysyl-tRNA synthetase class 2